MKRLFLICAFVLLGIGGAMAQESKAIKGFSGGMMIHSGYQVGCDNPFGYNLKGATFGIGGVARLHLTDHFRTGFEGYVSTLGLREGVAKGSHNKIFWTGLLADWYWQKGRFYPYVGATVGGGMETTYLMFEGDSGDWKPEPNAVFRKSGFVAVDPFVGCDIALGEAVRVTVKMDWLLAMRKSGLNSPTGPRLYVGFIFAH
ncbi:MAG: hypothetical protein J6Q28_03110 [Alistipes sp.]|nr:hypothetical protein [Alistipes sp.]